MEMVTYYIKLFITYYYFIFCLYMLKHIFTKIHNRHDKNKYSALMNWMKFCIRVQSDTIC